MTGSVDYFQLCLFFLTLLFFGLGLLRALLVFPSALLPAVVVPILVLLTLHPPSTISISRVVSLAASTLLTTFATLLQSTPQKCG